MAQNYLLFLGLLFQDKVLQVFEIILFTNSLLNHFYALVLIYCDGYSLFCLIYLTDIFLM